MALIAKVVKKLVKTIQPKLFSVIFNLVVTDGEVEVINQDFSFTHKVSDTEMSAKDFDFSKDSAGRIKGVIEEMQKVIDNYKTEKSILATAELENAVKNIERALSL